MSTIRDIARELNLSHTTVSRVLNTRQEQTISPATRARVWETARRMGYQPHTVARALVTGRTYQVALLMRYLYTAFHAQVVHEVEQTLRRAGYQVIVASMDTLGGGEDSPLHLPQQVDGYLAFETASLVRKLVANAGRTGKTVPLVAMGGHHLGDGLDRAGFDLAAGADAAMEHLLSLGRRRIAFVSDERDDPRRERYWHAIRTAGLPEEILLAPSQNRREVRAAVRQRLSGGDLPDALFCFNDEVAIGAYRALCDLGLRVPEDIALVGFDGIEDAEYLEKPLTTVALPIPEMCRLAWEMLERRLTAAESPTEPHQVMLQPTLVVRESTAGRGSTVAAAPAGVQVHP